MRAYRTALCLAMLLNIAACGAREDAAVLELWAMGREGELVQSLIPEFERQTPGVRVRVQQIPWSAAHEKLLTAFVGHALPDCFQVGNTWIPELAALGALAPLDRRVDASTSVRRNEYFPGILDTNVIDGQLYGIPWYVDTRVLFYRSDLLHAAGYDEPPRTWAAWQEAMARIKTAAGPSRYAVLLPLREWQPLVALALQRGSTLLRDGQRYGDFRAPAFRAAFDFYLDVFRRGRAPHTGEGQIANLYNDFGAGYFAFFISGPWNLGELRSRLPADTRDRWSTAPLPAPDGSAPGLSLAGGASLTMRQDTRHPEAVWALIEYLSAPAQQLALYRLTGDLPARRSAWNDPALRADVQAAAFARQLEHVGATPKIPEWERIATKIAEHTEAAVRSQRTPDEALAALDADVDAILEKRRWLLASKDTGSP
jgi:multiple sugar transport system substrate-binding protein